MRAFPILFLLGLAVAAPDDPAVGRGRKLFSDTQEHEYPSCSHCHSLLPPKEEQKDAAHLGPGGTLYGAVVREGWRNMNTYADVGEASQTCAKKWQGRKKGLTAAQRADLIALLATAAPDGPLEKRKVERRPRLLKEIEGGDAQKGKPLAERYCGGCHDKAEDAVSFELKPGGKKKWTIARAVRGYDAKRKFKPKAMSYFTTDRLSDTDLKHIIAYLGK
jgi:mono/diheme cytochrome c family protein